MELGFFILEHLKTDRIYLSPPHLTGEEQKYLQEAFAANWIAPIGKNLDTLENMFCEYAQTKYALAVNSGTSAIHLGLKGLGVGKNDYVICPTFTFVATANPVLYQQAKPVFVDSEPQTWNISLELTKQAILELIAQNIKPKAIIVVHLYGQSAQMDEINQISAKYDIPVLEDAAEALGSTYKNQKLGSLSKAGIYSLNGNKIITASSGGILVSDDAELIEKARFWSTQARDKAVHYQHSEMGYNYRMSNVLAGIACGQMEVLEERIKQRRFVFEYYKNALHDIPEISFWEESDIMFSNRWLTCLLLNDTESVSPETIRLALEAENIESRPFWKPLHLQPLFKNAKYYGSGIAEDLFKRGLCLPSGSALSEEQLERITRIIKNVFKKEKKKSGLVN